MKGLGACCGRRRDLDLVPLPRGGKREKKTKMEKRWRHPDAKSALKENFGANSFN